jgi:probable rRNA maturation factor
VKRRLKVSVQRAGTWPQLPSKAQVRRWVRAAAARSRSVAGQITVRFVDRDEGRRLNLDYRAKDYATNVLSFPTSRTPALRRPRPLRAGRRREAATQGKSLERITPT